MRNRRVLVFLALGIGAVSSAVAQPVRISEILASNTDGLLDSDGDTSDWIELVNLGSSTVDLGGWALANDPLDLQQWRFPPGTLLGPGDFLVVLASGKDRSVLGQELHASFRLDADGDYLALVRPDGVTIEHELAPAYPPQRADVSYGLAQAVNESVLVTRGSAARLLVPTSGGLGTSWTQASFVDGAWTPVTLGVGFETADDTSDPGTGDLVNAAEEGTPSQSSTLGDFVATGAIDGNFSNFTHTQAGVNLPATWQIDLDTTYAIETITIHNRADCCGSRLRDIRVSILDAGGAVTLFQSPLLNAENALGAYPNGPSTLTVDLVASTGAAVRGRIVRVVRTPDPDRSGSGGQGNADEADVLQIAEVEILGRASTAPPAFGDLIQTDLETVLHGVNASAYVRAPFQLTDPAAIELLKLRLRHDDGFVAYLNGEEIARRNAPASPSWSSTATAEHPDAQAIVAEEINVSQHIGLLRAGSNVLAIHGLNLSASDTDFLLVPELVAQSIQGDALRFFRTPTPGAPNPASGIVGFVADTKFNFDRGFYETAIAVEISSLTAGAQIRYTLNGVPPTTTSGTLYSGPIAISRTTTLRAIAYLTGLEPTNVDTQTYLFLDDVIAQSYQATINAGFPATWGGTSPDYGMDPDVIGQTGPDRYGGKYAATIRNDLLAIPTMSITLKVDDLFGANGIYTNSGSRGIAWERACSVELMHPDGTPGFQINCGLRVQGGAFRSHGLTKKHSFRLLFKDLYGPTKLQYPIFGAGAVDSFDTMVLRANSNDGWQWDAAGSKPLYVRDSFGRETMLAMGQLSSHETFVHLYLNGVYWGLYNPVERPDHAFSASYCGGDKDDWDAMSNSALTNGTLAAWNTLQTMTSQGFSTTAAFLRLQGKNPDGTENPALPAYLDLENYIDYMIVNLWVGNTDWPNKNWWACRDRDPIRSTGFKHYMWDSEWSMGIQSDLNTNQTGVSTGVAAPYAALRANPEFRLQFADHVERHFSEGGALYIDAQNPAWNAARPERNLPAARFVRLTDIVDRPVVAESARWGDQHATVPYTRDEHWAPERTSVLSGYLSARTARVLDQFRAAGLYPGIAAPTFSRKPGSVTAPFDLLIRTASGTAYYTLDGSDPRLLGGAVSPQAQIAAVGSATTLLTTGADVRVLVPANDSLGLGWTARDFADGAWQSGQSGVGYERDTGYEALIATDVETAMFQVNASVYLRLAFEVSDPGSVASLTLRMKFDDGFIAYLNGDRVAAVNAPEPLSWNSAATASNADSAAVVFASFDITASTSALRAGRNVLAVHGLNSSATSSDVLFVPELVASTTSEAQGIDISRSSRVLSRAFLAGEWSALSEAAYALDSSALKVTELMYHPPAPPVGSPHSQESFEFIEIQNTGSRPVNLTGLRFVAGINFAFPDGDGAPQDDLLPGEVVLVVRNLAAFASRYDTRNLYIAGEYTGQLQNGGELVFLEDRGRNIVASFTYADTWYPETDGLGSSLEIADAAQAPAMWSQAEGWRPSTAAGGSPGVVGPPTGGVGRRPGDANGDGALDLGDALALLFMLFVNDTALPCEGDLASAGNRALLDTSGDGFVNLSDAISILNYLFRNGSPPQRGTRCVPTAGCGDACSG